MIKVGKLEKDGCNKAQPRQVRMSDLETMETLTLVFGLLPQLMWPPTVYEVPLVV